MNNESKVISDDFFAPLRELSKEIDEEKEKKEDEKKHPTS